MTATTFTSSDPSTGQPVATHPLHDADDVAAAVARARAAGVWWRALDHHERGRALRRWAAALADRADEAAALVRAENGKPVDDALTEVVLSVHHVRWAAANAHRVLGRRRVRPGWLAADHSASLEYQPLGVVAVIGPWNYPLFTPMGPIGCALAAGDTVVFKPSEHTPGVAVWLADTLREAVGRTGLLEVVTGDGSTGAALAAADVDKVAFTGSASTGRAVMAACAQRLTPVLMECGGSDAMIVAADADLDAAADAALWGAMGNAGQTCIGIERVYVVEQVADAFLARVRAGAARLRPGRDYGPMTVAAQAGVVERHVAGAIEGGARPVVGGPSRRGGTLVAPVVLTDVAEDAAVVREETFGPVLVVNRVADLDDGLARANAVDGLGSSVWTSSTPTGMDLARRLRSGMTAVNGVLTFAAVPSLPFGGLGESGFGRTHGDDGLREMSRAKAVTRRRVRLPIRLASFDRPSGAVRFLAAVCRLVARSPRPSVRR